MTLIKILKSIKPFFNIFIICIGDTSSVASVRCSTQSGSAKGSDEVTNHNSDFISRPDTDASLVIFQPGEHVKLCQLQVKLNFEYTLIIMLN
jgi:hypothetical protein